MDDEQKVIADPASAHWYAWDAEELVCKPMGRDDDPNELPAHPATLTEDEAFMDEWYAVDFDSAFDERDPEDVALVARIRNIEAELKQS